MVEDLKWDRLIDLVRIKYQNIPIKHPSIKPVFLAFVSNFQRTREMIVVMSQVGHVGMRMQWAYDHALFEETGGLVHSNDPKILALAEDKLRNNLREEAELAEAGGDEWSSRLSDLIENGTRAVERFDSVGGKRALSEFFASTIVSTWATFETMAGDLWEAALNGHPKGLSELKGTKKPKTTTRGESEQFDTRDAKPIALEWLHRYGFDLREKMGTALRSNQRFDSLAGIRESYMRAFYKKSESIEEVLNDSALDALSAVRNVLVHRSGAVDDEYARRAKYLPIPIGPIGTRIEMDGDVVHKLVAPVSQRSIDLIVAVDSWLMTEK